MTRDLLMMTFIDSYKLQKMMGVLRLDKTSVPTDPTDQTVANTLFSACHALHES